MVKCPNCGSTAQVQKYDWDIHFENEDEISIYREYVCKGCGEYFRTERLYRADGWEMVCEEEE
jgi:C4-type Zn-finger protein